MKWPEEKMSLNEARLAYRRAVVAMMTTFLEVDKGKAKTLVSAWWERMQGSEVFAIGLFLHEEPINTAAGLLHERTPAIRELGDKYFEVLKDSMPKRRKKHNLIHTSTVRVAKAA